MWNPKWPKAVDPTQKEVAFSRGEICTRAVFAERGMQEDMRGDHWVYQLMMDKTKEST